jgi:hopanoid C-3 methylase
MRILLIHPPDNRYSIAPGKLEPLGLEVLAACLPGHEVRIIDLRMDSIRELNRQLVAFRPVVVGLTVNNTINVIAARSVLNHIRTRYPEMCLIVGGHHPTMIPSDFHIPSVDFIFLGWAERSLPAFLETIESSGDFGLIDGIEILENGRLVTRNVNGFHLNAPDIPFPRRDLVQKYLNRYRSDTFRLTGLVNTTRGCANRCTFCSVWQSSGGKVIVRPPEDVFCEIANLPQNYRHVFFADDNSFINPDNHYRLYELINSNGIKKKYSGYCRSDTIVKYPDLMAAWKSIGLENLCVGFEGTDNSGIEEYNKKNMVENNEEAASILNKLKIPFRPHFLISPSFMQADFDRIRKYVHRVRLNSPVFPILTPIPGTESYKEVEDQIILDYNYFDYAHSVLSTKMPVREFYKTWMKLYFSFYSANLTIRRMLRKNYGRLIRNKQMYEDNHHLRITNLLILLFISVFLRLKIKRHIRMVESLRSTDDSFRPEYEDVTKIPEFVTE